MKKDVENKKKIQINGFPKTAFMKKQDMDALVSLFYLRLINIYFFVHARKSGIDTVKKARKKPLIYSLS